VSDFPARRGTVLVIEDDERLRRSLTRVLESAGFCVLSANDGEAALLVARGLSTISLVLTDIWMPVMDGLEFARAYSALYPSTPILFMTGALPEGSSGVSLLEVAGRLLLKPFDPETLLEAVNAALSYGPSARRTPA